MAGTSRDAGRSGGTPGWAWAVAGLCGLLLIPVAMENDHLTKANPLHVAGPAAHPAQLNLAGHATTHAGTPARTPLVVSGRTRTATQATFSGGTGAGVAALGPSLGEQVGPSVPANGLDLQNPTGALGTGESTGSAVSATGRGLGRVSLVSTGDGTLLAWGGLHPNGAPVTRHQKAPSAGALTKSGPAAPRPRPWARHLHRWGPASRIRRRRHPRFFGFYVAPSAN